MKRGTKIENEFMDMFTKVTGVKFVDVTPIKNVKVVQHKTHDYTEEICRCISDIFFHLRRGDTLQEAILKAEGSYGYTITLNARRAIYKKFKNK